MIRNLVISIPFVILTSTSAIACTVDAERFSNLQVGMNYSDVENVLSCLGSSSDREEVNDRAYVTAVWTDAQTDRPLTTVFDAGQLVSMSLGNYP